MTDPADREGVVTNLKPGVVAVVSSWRGELRGMKSHAGWMVVDGSQTRGLEDTEVTAVRRLIVLDLLPYSPGILANLIESIDMAGHVSVAQSIREQTKPPRIPEPGLHGVVQARTLRGEGALQWTRYTTGDGYRNQWIGTNGDVAFWEYLVDPILIQGGSS